MDHKITIVLLSSLSIFSVPIIEISEQHVILLMVPENCKHQHQFSSLCLYFIQLHFNSGLYSSSLAFIQRMNGNQHSLLCNFWGVLLLTPGKGSLRSFFHEANQHLCIYSRVWFPHKFQNRSMKSKIYLKNTKVHLVSKESVAPIYYKQSFLYRICRSSLRELPVT